MGGTTTVSVEIETASAPTEEAAINQVVNLLDGAVEIGEIGGYSYTTDGEEEEEERQ